MTQPPPRPDDTLRLFSHDIRAAMSDVIGGLRLVDLTRLDPDTRMQLERVAAAGDTLAELVDAVLMAAAGQPVMADATDRVALQALLTGLGHRWSGRARERQLGFDMHCDDGLPQYVAAPRVMLDRIIGNLIHNALRHAASAVEIRVTLSDGDELCVAVADRGPGFPDSVLAGFAGDAADRAMGRLAGEGLGLRIAKELSAQIGAELHIANRIDGGAEAVLRLPRVLLQQTGRKTPADMPDLSGLRILLAEDNPTNQTILRQTLGQMGNVPVIVGDGVEALEELDRQPFDIALIDIEMPRLSGLEVLRRTRARTDVVATMPMVALTAYVLRDNREAIYAAGADGIIGKPIVSGADFGRAVLRHAGRPAGLPEPEDVLNGDTELGVPMNHERFEALLRVAGPVEAVELLARLDEDLRAVDQRLRAGVSNGELSAIREQTHILIALAGAVGAERLFGLAEVLNIAAKRKRVADMAALHAPCAADLAVLISLISARRDSMR